MSQPRLGLPKLLAIVNESKERLKIRISHHGGTGSVVSAEIDIDDHLAVELQPGRYDIHARSQSRDITSSHVIHEVNTAHYGDAEFDEVITYGPVWGG